MNNPLVQLDPGLFVWTILTFLLLLTVLTKFAWKPLLKMLKDREDLIRTSLEDAEKAQTELAKLNAEGEEIINKARAEAQEILSQGKSSAVKMKEETLNDAKEKVSAGAETIAFDDYVALGGESGAREAGKLRQEGKEYVVQDGDVMLFKFNV